MFCVHQDETLAQHADILRLSVMRHWPLVYLPDLLHLVSIRTVIKEVVKGHCVIREDLTKSRPKVIAVDGVRGSCRQ